MNISKSTLLTALESVKPGLSNKEIIEQTNSFAFMEGRVITYNDEISISHPVSELSDITGVIKADELYKILVKMKEDNLEVDYNDESSELVIKSGRAKAGLLVQPDIKLPIDEDIKTKGKWKDIPKGFLKFVGFSLTSCAKDMTQPRLTCVHCSKDGVVESSDNYRITRCTMEEELPIDTFLLPASSAISVVKLNPTKMAQGKGWVHFKTEDDTIISCRILEEEYPNTVPFLKVDGPLLVLPQSLQEALDSAGVFAKRDTLTHETVEITLSNNKITVESKSDTGWYSEALNIKYNKEPISFAVTPYLLKSILSETQGCIYGKTKLKFEGEGWVYMSLLKG